ncbi:MAG: Na+/H+ antiporter NhaA [Salinivirgaceae bacterium]|nr:Na+/H+ antiporter NhaA [Salinivirgaceae bacterium]
MVNYIIKPFERFFKTESSGSILLFIATITALIIANSPLFELYDSILHQPLKIGFQDFKLEKPLILWINDGLMAIFFFVIGLEIKREILVGELNNIQKASLPIFGALGGMIIPVLLFLALQYGKTGIEGWGIPMATDIAFTLGILKILGKRIPIGLTIFLTAFAIVDDIGAVLVIALFYSANIKWALVLIALALWLILFLFGWFKIYSKYLFYIFGFAIWVLFLKSGIHPTIAGILVAFSFPVRRKIKTYKFYKEAKESLEEFRCNEDDIPEFLTEKQRGAIFDLESMIDKTISPLQQLEHKLHGWVVYFIMPIFAFANAGVHFSGEILPLSWNISISMILGKSIGVALFAFLAIKLNLAKLPENVNFSQIIGVAFLGGLGFTMALFISGLAYTDPLLINGSKTGILIGSLLAGLIGYLILRFSTKKSK